MILRKYSLTYSAIFQSSLALLAILLLGNTQAHTQSIDTVLVYETSLNADDPVFISISSADVDVVTHKSNDLRVEYHVDVEGRSSQEVREFIKSMDKAIKGRNKPVDSKNAIGGPVVKWKTVNGRTTITLKVNGDSKRYKVKDWKLGIKIHMPEHAKTHARMSFANLSITKLTNDAMIEISSGKLKLQSCSNLRFRGNFVEAVDIGDLGAANINLNSSKFTANEVRTSLKMNANFSTIKVNRIGNSAKLNLNSSSFTGESVDSLKVSGNFVRSFNIEQVKVAKLSMNSSSFAVERAERLDISGANFSKFKIENCDAIRIGGSSSSKFLIENVNSVIASGSRFSTFKIENLSKKFVVNASSGDLTIENVQKGFELIKVKGQFFTTKIHLANDADCKLEARFQFPDYKFKGFITMDKVTTNGLERITAEKGKNSTSRISLDCQSCDVVVD